MFILIVYNLCSTYFKTCSSGFFVIMSINVNEKF